MRTLRRWTALGLVAATVITAPVVHAQQWSTTLSGSTEIPPNSSPGTGFALLTLTGSSLRIQASFSGLVGNTTVAHIHCCTATPGSGSAGVASPVPSYPGFPAGGTSGSYDQTFDLLLSSSWNPAFITSSGGTTAQAMTRLVAALNARTAYLNVHSTTFPGGEINGYFTPVPEPATFALLAAGLLGVGLVARRRARS